MFAARRFFYSVLCCAGAILLTVVLSSSRQPDPVEVDARATSVELGDEYIGSHRCTECHPEETASFRESPMGQSAAIANTALATQFHGTIDFKPDTLPFHYQLERRDETVTLTEESLDPANRVRSSQQEELVYAFGSGANAQTFLVKKPRGFLFEAPLTWYHQLNGWEMSPGFANTNHYGFSRPISEGCVSCHTGGGRLVAGSVNRYDPQEPFFELAINCERCHGPGRGHVDRHLGGTSDFDDVIVNPMKLKGNLASDICFQCHRSEGATVTVLRPGKSLHDFRPGREFAEIGERIQVDAREQKSSGIHFTGKFEQLWSSRCYLASEGNLHCHQCHKVHGSTDGKSNIERHRQNCLRCHKSESCGLDIADRQLQSPKDSCYHCHMPVVSPVDIPHSAITDHHIRVVGKNKHSIDSSRPAANGSVAISKSEHERNRAIANFRFAGRTTESREHFFKGALKHFARAQELGAGDLEFHTFYGACLLNLGHVKEAKTQLELAVSLQPENETALAELARTYGLLRDIPAARTTLERVLELNPHHQFARLALNKLNSATKHGVQE